MVRMGVKAKHISSGNVGVVCGIFRGESCVNQSLCRADLHVRVVTEEAVFIVGNEKDFTYFGNKPDTGLMQKALVNWNKERGRSRPLTLDQAFK